MITTWLKLYRSAHHSNRFRARSHRAQRAFCLWLSAADERGEIELGGLKPAAWLERHFGATAAERKGRVVHRALDELLEHGHLALDEAADVLRFPGFEEKQASTTTRTRRGARPVNERPESGRSSVSDRSVIGKRSVDDPSVMRTQVPENTQSEMTDIEGEEEGEEETPLHPLLRPPSESEAKANREAGRQARADALREWTPQALYEALNSAWVTHHGIAFGLTPSQVELVQLGKVLDSRSMTRAEMLEQVSAFARVQKIYKSHPERRPPKLGDVRKHVGLFTRFVPQWPERLRAAAEAA